MLVMSGRARSRSTISCQAGARVLRHPVTRKVRVLPHAGGDLDPSAEPIDVRHYDPDVTYFGNGQITYRRAGGGYVLSGRARRRSTHSCPAGARSPSSATIASSISASSAVSRVTRRSLAAGCTTRPMVRNCALPSYR